MAKTGAVWGIDLGQCALKALRCRAGDTPDTIVAEAFDYIEYPKMLSQPDANPAELIQEALESSSRATRSRAIEWRSRFPAKAAWRGSSNCRRSKRKRFPTSSNTKPGSKFPSQLEDVVWDYQQMAGGSVEEGFAPGDRSRPVRDEARPGRLAHCEPFVDAGIEVDIVQLTPLALYNFVTFDQMHDMPPAGAIQIPTIRPRVDCDVRWAPTCRIWSSPTASACGSGACNLGGNHFTKALTKQMKLTFAKAEHLKRNAMKAEDPKAVFQAMRPVFSELLG